MTNSITKATLILLGVGFALALVLDIVALLGGKAMALPFLGLILIMAWLTYKLVIELIPPVFIEAVEGTGDVREAGDKARGFVSVITDDPDGAAAAAWTNILNAALGSAGTMPLDDLSAEHRGCMIVVFPSSGEDNTQAGISEKILESAGAGRVVIVDDPKPDTAAALGLEILDEDISGSDFLVDGDILTAAQRKEFETMPVAPPLRAAGELPAGWAVWLRIDNHPALISKPVESGAVIISLFPLAELATRLRQGVTQAEWTAAVAGPRPWHRAYLNMRRNAVPYADLLGTLIVNLMGRYAPVPAWWPHRDAAPGTLIVTAADDYSGARTRVISDIAGDVSPTLFVLPDSDTGDATLKDMNFSAGLLWNRSPLHGARGLRRNPHQTLQEQLSALEQKTSSAAPGVARTYQSRLDGGPDACLAVMEQGGLAADCSFGPGPGQQGYIFATGFPFRPISDEGRAWHILELPYHLHDMSGVRDEWLAEMLEHATENFHSPITLLLHPLNCLKSQAVRQGYKKLVDKARARGLHVAGAQDYIAFWQARQDSSLELEWDGATLAANVTVRGQGMSLALPAVYRGRTPSAVRVDGEDARPQGNLLPLAPGQHEIIVEFSSNES